VRRSTVILTLSVAKGKDLLALGRRIAGESRSFDSALRAPLRMTTWQA